MIYKNILYAVSCDLFAAPDGKGTDRHRPAPDRDQSKADPGPVLVGRGKITRNAVRISFDHFFSNFLDASNQLII